MDYENRSYNKTNNNGKSNNRINYYDEIITSYSDYVDRAEKVIKKVKELKIGLTASQLRNFLALVIKVSNKIDIAKLDEQIKGDILPEDVVSMILNMRAKLVYQMAREGEVKNFAIIADLENELKEIKNSYSKFKEFNLYLEAIVSYHKLYINK